MYENGQKMWLQIKMKWQKHKFEFIFKQYESFSEKINNPKDLIARWSDDKIKSWNCKNHGVIWKNFELLSFHHSAVVHFKFSILSL